MAFHRYMLTGVASWHRLMVIKGVPTMINSHNFASGPGTPTLKIVMGGQNTMNNKYSDSEYYVETLSLQCKLLWTYTSLHRASEKTLWPDENGSKKQSHSPTCPDVKSCPPATPSCLVSIIPRSLHWTGSLFKFFLLFCLCWPCSV